MPAKLYDQAIQNLRASKASMRCADASKLLESLGFQIRDGKAPGHKIYTHVGLADFHSSSFNCDHGKNPQIKPAYVTNILRVLAAHESALKSYLEKN